jgi:hypothetical protein
MARIDKADSTVGVVRADLGADLPLDTMDTIIGVGLNSAGRILPGAANTGVVGVMNPNRKVRLAGKRADIFKTGEAVEMEGLQPGRNAYAAHATGVVSTPAAAPAAADFTKVGYTVEADRLIIQL